ncbi:unnamed protein product [Staurois parvus]|uniref:Uncharacterized protein n=1 Tax=Staurois parvus TaxID=386267 RepID=A0ABN9H1R6_9NEOB|nr:unnamed protein product [Staurois parvus]
MMSQITLHVITDWPISDHMIGTSYRGPIRRSVFHCARRTQRAPDRGATRSQGAATRPCSATIRPFICNGQSGSG